MPLVEAEAVLVVQEASEAASVAPTVVDQGEVEACPVDEAEAAEEAVAVAAQEAQAMARSAHKSKKRISRSHHHNFS